MDGEDKKSVRVTIFNQTFTLRVTGDPQDLTRAAAEVDELMTAIAKSGNMDAARIAMLACLHLQDKVDTLTAELDALRERSRELASMLDGVVEE